MSESPEFSRVFSSTKNSDKLRGEKEELISRFYALSNNYKNFVHSVKDFMDDYIIETGKELTKTSKDSFRAELLDTLSFVEKNFPNGLKKSPTAKSIQEFVLKRYLLEQFLALRENPNLKITNVNWIDSDEFRKWTTSDGANSKSKVTGRIEFVRDCLLGGIDSNTLTYDN